MIMLQDHVADLDKLQATCRYGNCCGRLFFILLENSSVQCIGMQLLGKYVNCRWLLDFCNLSATVVIIWTAMSAE
jgi:hypothetical protein